jgi:hypothetical protein
MVTVVICALLQAVFGQHKARWVGPAAAGMAAIVVLTTIPAVSTYGAVNTMESMRGTIFADAKAACKTGGSPVTVDIYPVDKWEVSRPRKEVCTRRLSGLTVSRNIDLGLGIGANNPVDITGGRLTQRFSLPAGAGPLHGIRIFLSTYQLWNRSHYRLTLYRSDCRTAIRTADFNGLGVTDNEFALIKFAPTTEGTDFCWSIAPQGIGARDLAVQLSSTNPQSVPPADVDGKPIAGPVTFQPVVLER